MKYLFLYLGIIIISVQSTLAEQHFLFTTSPLVNEEEFERFTKLIEQNIDKRVNTKRLSLFDSLSETDTFTLKFEKKSADTQLIRVIDKGTNLNYEFRVQNCANFESAVENMYVNIVALCSNPLVGKLERFNIGHKNILGNLSYTNCNIVRFCRGNLYFRYIYKDNQVINYNKVIEVAKYVDKLVCEFNNIPYDDLSMDLDNEDGVSDSKNNQEKNNISKQKQKKKILSEEVNDIKKESCFDSQNKKDIYLKDSKDSEVIWYWLIGIVTMILSVIFLQKKMKR